MRLGHAVEGWLGAHHGALSPSTKQDIEEIGIAIAVCGLDEVNCETVDASDRTEIAAEAGGRTSLTPTAIGEFLTIVVDWGLANSPATAEPPLRSDRETWASDAWSGAAPTQWPAETDNDVFDLVPSWTTDETAPTAPPVVDDLERATEAWADELPPIADAEFDQPEAPAGSELTPENDPDDEPVLTDEDDLDDEELAVIDADLARVAPPGPPADHDTATPAAFEDPAASSFLQTIGRSAATTTAFDDLTTPPDQPTQPPVPSTPDARGIFSEAAQFDGRKRSIDWLTVTYFVVAAICFGFVIYFYLSS